MYTNTMYFQSTIEIAMWISYFWPIEGTEQLINDTNSETVDSSVFEHMDIDC